MLWAFDILSSIFYDIINFEEFFIAKKAERNDIIKKVVFELLIKSENTQKKFFNYVKIISKAFNTVSYSKEAIRIKDYVDFFQEVKDQAIRIKEKPEEGVVAAAPPPVSKEFRKRARVGFSTWVDRIRAIEMPWFRRKKAPIPPSKVKLIPAEKERIINTGFSSLDFPGEYLKKESPLSPNTSYYFTFDVGKLHEGSMELEPEPLQIELLPDQARLKVVLFSFDGEIEITAGMDIGEIKIMPDWEIKVVKKVEIPDLPKSKSGLIMRRLFFPVRTPKKEGLFRLRCNLYCEQTLIQSRLITARVANKKNPLDDPALSSILEYSLSKSLNPQLLANLKPQKLSIMLNDNGKGTHTFRIFGEKGKYEKDFSVGTLKNLIKIARNALHFTYWGSFGEHIDEKIKYKKLDLYSLRKDLILLAKNGAEFWLKLTQKVAPEENYLELRDMLKKPSTIEFVIKDASEAANYMFPAAIIYDYPLLTNLDDQEYSLCSSFLEAINNKTPLENTPCFKGNCPSRNSADLKIVCPSGFWGFRHSIGLPLGSASEPNQEILFSKTPELTAAAYTSFKSWPSHKSAIEEINENYKWQIAQTYSEAITQFSSTKPHLLYFFCHGGYNKAKTIPYLKVGSIKTKQTINPNSFASIEIRWNQTHPLVFINGCHTVGMDPGHVLDFASTFVLSLKASGVIGTEITTFSSLATNFAEHWLTLFLSNDGETAGNAMLKTRLKILEKGNPLGLIYNLYANANLRLKKETL